MSVHTISSVFSFRNTRHRSMVHQSKKIVPCEVLFNRAVTKQGPPRRREHAPANSKRNAWKANKYDILDAAYRHEKDPESTCRLLYKRERLENHMPCRREFISAAQTNKLTQTTLPVKSENRYRYEEVTDLESELKAISDSIWPRTMKHKETTAQQDCRLDSEKCQHCSRL